MATLSYIRTLVRRLTRSPSQAQLTDAELDLYINTFILWDMPYTIQLFDLKRTLTFHTRPYIDTYGTNDVDNNDPLFDFKNRYINIMSPIFLNGVPISLIQDSREFWLRYPTGNYIMALPQHGDGITTRFEGTLPHKTVLQNTLTFNSIGLVGDNNVGLTLADSPNYVNGNKQTTGSFVIPSELGVISSINYVTGAFLVTFPTPPAPGQPIYAQYYPYMASIPTTVLYYNSTFTFRPIPNRSYTVKCDAMIQPSELLNVGDMPELKQWWQYIAYGAAKKVFEGRLDNESVQLIMPEFKNQEILCMRKKIKQNSRRSMQTIFNQLS